jgi:DNA (cytosine-5)-methyltransferase 1
MAGKRKGKEDERHLWPEMLRCIREVKPRWVVGENVLGLVNWSGGLVFHEVQSDLEAEGYEVFPYVLAAAAVNAPHRRDRVWFVAYSKCISRKTTFRIQNKCKPIEQKFINDGEIWDASYTDGIGLRRESNRIGESGFVGKNESGNNWQIFPTVSPICSGNDGLSDRLDSITFSKWRKESIKAGGNAIVPQVALQIFKTIQQYESRTN